MTEQLRHTPDSISAQTYLRQEKQWFESFAQNIQAVRTGKNITGLRNGCKGPCIVLGAGPSVMKFDHLRSVAASKLHVLCTDRMLSPMLALKKTPDVVVTVDGSEMISGFYRDQALVRAALPVNVHPSVTWKARRRGEVYWYVPVLDDVGAPASVTRALVHMSGGKLAGHAYGNAGAFAWSLAEFMGHDPIILVGIDFSYGTDAKPEDTTYWEGFVAHRKGDVVGTLEKDYRWEVNPFGYRVLTDAVWDGYRDVFLKGIKEHDGEHSRAVTTINTSEYTTLHGDGVKTMSLEEALKLAPPSLLAGVD